jgi:hypothetical protein
MKKLSDFKGLALASVVAVTGAAAAQAQDAAKPYVGIMYSQVDFEELDVKPAMVLGLIGWPVGEYFAVEARAGAGVKSIRDAAFVGGTFVTAELKINHYYGGFVRGTLPVGENFNLYGIVGYGSGESEITTNVGFDVTESESSEAYGLGAEVVFGADKSHHFGFEWAKYFEDTSAVSVIYRLKF